MSRPSPAKPDLASQNLYAFLRLRLGDALSDRELARRWQMEWKSFSALKHGRRQVPRLGELEQLARLLGVAPAFVFEVARGVSAHEVHALLVENDGAKLSKLLMAGGGAVRRQGESAGERYVSVLDRVSDAVFTFDVQGRLQDVNKRLCALTGFTSTELLERSFFDLLAPAERPGLVQKAASVYQTGQVYGATFGVTARDGSELTLELGLTRIDDEGGHAIGIQAVAHDVTLHRRLEEQLRQQVATLQTTFDAVPAACLLFAKNGTILACNRRIEQVTDFSDTEVLGRNAFDIFPTPGPAGCPVTRAFQTGKVERQLSKMTNKRAEEVFVHRTAGPVFGAGGQVDRVVEILVDVSEQVRGDPELSRLWGMELSEGADAMIAGREYRKFVRIPHDAPVKLRVGRHRALAVARNLGRGGICLQTEAAVVVGSEVSLEWRVPGGRSAVAAKGVVVWTQPGSVGAAAGIGIEFLQLTPPNQKLIARCITAARTTGPRREDMRRSPRRTRSR